MRKKQKRYIFTIFLILLVLAVVWIVSKPFGKSDIPPTLVKNFVDLDKVEKISKFRSCQGHTVVPVDGSESKRNMKHYVILKPEYWGSNAVPLYAPYDAKVSMFSSPEDGLEGEIWFDGGNEWQFSIEHINILESIKGGDKVQAGQLVGYVPDKGFDVVYAIGAPEPKEIDGWVSPFAALDSVFLHMEEGVFSEFLERSVDKSQNFIYSKEYRDNNPCEYRDDRGGLNDAEHPEDWVMLQ